MSNQNDRANVDLYVNDDYILTFGYPVNVPHAMQFLTRQLERTMEFCDDIMQNLGSLIQDSLVHLPDDLSTMSDQEQAQFVFLLCGFLKYLCDEENDQLEAGSHYHFKLIIDEEGMVAEMYDVMSVH